MVYLVYGRPTLWQPADGRLQQWLSEKGDWIKTPPVAALVEICCHPRLYTLVEFCGPFQLGSSISLDPIHIIWLASCLFGATTEANDDGDTTMMCQVPQHDFRQASAATRPEKVISAEVVNKEEAPQQQALHNNKQEPLFCRAGGWIAQWAPQCSNTSIIKKTQKRQSTVTQQHVEDLLDSMMIQ